MHWMERVSCAPDSDRLGDPIATGGRVSRDSVTGFVDGPLERVAFARTDVRQLQRQGAKPGRTLALIGGVVAGFMLYAIGTMGSFSLAGTP